MNYTSSEANKMLKTLEAKRNSLLLKEEKVSAFVISAGENADELRPEYDFDKAQKEIGEVNEKIRTVKHAINLFNTTHTVPGFGNMTIDQALVYMPQLTHKVNKLARMAAALPRERNVSYRMNIVEYTIANYDPEEVEKACDMAREELNALQLAIDAVNNSETMEIDVTLE